MITRESRVRENSIGIEAFEEIYQRYRYLVVQRIRGMLGPECHEQIEDLVQDTFFHVYRSFREGNMLSPTAVSSWIYRIATNITIDILRRQRCLVFVPYTSSDRWGKAYENDVLDRVTWIVSADEEHFEQRIANRESIVRVLLQMPRLSAACLWRYEHEGFSCKEIASQFHTSEASVRMRLMRARIRFRVLYQHEEALMIG